MAQVCLTSRRAAAIAMIVACGAGCKSAPPSATVEGPAAITPAPAGGAPAPAGAAAAPTASAAAPAAAAGAAPAPLPAPPPAPPSCVDDGAPYGEAELRARVALLAAPELDGRAPGTDGDRAARTHIVERFRCLGLAAGGERGSYEQPFDDTANVIGYVAGSDPKVGAEIVLVGAHHDHLGGGKLGANDNASGVAALLAVAQAVRQAGAPRRTIAFVTYGAEERGLVGSTYLVAHPPAALPLDRIVEVINLDMVGSHASARAVYAFGAFPRLAARAILAALGPKYPKLSVGLGGHSVRGDHLGFCQKGIPYVFFWTPDRRCYHEACDTADRLDYPRMADIASLAGGLVQRLADTDVDLAAARARAGCGAK